jgi:hypothetical protein
MQAALQAIVARAALIVLQSSQRLFTKIVARQKLLVAPVTFRH